MNKKKIIMTASAVALAAVLALGGTLAYYQGQAEDPVENTLVDQGNSVSISETDVDGDDSTQSNTYSIIPGTTDKKDPVITAEYTLDSYVYVKADDTTEGWIEWAIANGWAELGDGYDGVYYMLLKTFQYDASTWMDYSYTDNDKGLTYSYDPSLKIYTVKNSSATTLYTYTVESTDTITGNAIDVYTASIPVILNNIVTYSSEITNDTFEGYGSTVSLDFTAYIIQASLNNGTDEDDDYGEKEYSNAELAYYYVNQEDYYEAAATNGNVAAIGMTVYTTLNDAISVASDGDTVTLLQDITVDSAVYIPAGTRISLDLGGNSITATSNSAIDVEGTLTALTNGTINGKYYGVYVSSGTIEELNVDIRVGAESTDGSSLSAIFVYNYGKIDKITGGTYEAYADQYTTAITMSPCILVWNGSIGEISDGTFVSRGNTININWGTSSIELISGGTFISAYIPEDALNWAYSSTELQGGIMWSSSKGPNSVTGGVFYNLGGSTKYANAITNNIADGYELVKTEILAASSYLKYVAYDSSSGTKAHYEVCDDVVNEYYFWEVVSSSTSSNESE